MLVDRRDIDINRYLSSPIQVYIDEVYKYINGIISGFLGPSSRNIFSICLIYNDIIVGHLQVICVLRPSWRTRS